MIKKITTIFLPIVALSTWAHSQKISGSVFVDGNKNKIFDANEIRCSNVKVRAYQIESNGKEIEIASVVTDESGAYSIKNVPDNLRVKIYFDFPMKYANREFGASSAMISSIVTESGNLQANFFITPSN